MKSNPALSALDRTLGTWSVTGTHPMMPGRTLRGEVTFERVEGGAFVCVRSKMVDPEIPEGIALFGTDDEHGTCTLIYFDARGVSRNYTVTFHDDGFTWSRASEKLAQRFRLTIASDGASMLGEGSMQQDGGAWGPDLRLEYGSKR